MHSLIFQICDQPIEDVLNEDTLEEETTIGYDYFHEISEEEKEKEIDYLVNEVLPKGMFTRMGKDQLVFNGGEEWAAEYVRHIQQLAEQLTPKKAINDYAGVIASDNCKSLQRYIKNPCDSDFHFYPYTTRYGNTQLSGEFLRETCRYSKAGDIYYIGGVINYHY